MLPPFQHRRRCKETTVKKLATILMLISLATGCTVGPNYKRPSVDVPGGYRGAAPPSQATQSGKEQKEDQSAEAAAQPPEKATQSLGDEQWWEVFQDPQLQELIRTALKNNYDVNIAAARILKAQAQLGITRADQLPTLGVGAAAINFDAPKNKFTGNTDSSVNAADASFNWQLDFWASIAAPPKRRAQIWSRRAGHEST